MAFGPNDVSNLLEKVIGPAIQSQLFEENFLTDWLRKNAGVQKLSNSEFYLTVIKGRNPSIGFLADSTTVLDTTMQDITSQTKISAKFGFANLRFDDRAIEATKDDKGALKDLVSTYGDQIKSDLAKDMNRQFFGYGNGQLALANGAGTASVTLTVDTPGTEYLDVGMNLIIGTCEAVRITAVDSETQVTIAAPRTWADNVVITRADASGAAVSEMMGLAGIIDDGDLISANFQGYATRPTWFKAYVDDTAEALSIADMVTTYHKAMKFSKRNAEVAVIMGQTLYEKYGSLLTNPAATYQATHVNMSKDYEFAGGWKGLAFMGGKAGVYLDFDCTDKAVYFVNRDALTVAQLTPVSWMPGSNGVLTKVPGSTLWESTLRFYGNLGAKLVRANSGMRGKTA